MTKTTRTISTLLALGFAACNGSAGGTASGAGTLLLSSFPPSSSANLRVSLTDAPSKEKKSVIVNVDHIELFVAKNGSEGRILLANGLGPVDLMKLRNGVLLPVADLSLAPGTSITHIRWVLAGTGNYGVRADDSICAMQTPSGQQSGIKIQLAEPFAVDVEHIFSMVVDFDAAKSVVVKGNGDCLLKPVLRLAQVTQIADHGGAPETPVPITSGGDTNTPTSGGNTAAGDNSGFEPPTSGTTDPPVITIEDTYNFG